MADCASHSPDHMAVAMAVTTNYETRGLLVAKGRPSRVFFARWQRRGGRTGAGEPRRVPYRVMRGAELVPTRSDVGGPWNECVFERVAREVDDGSRTI